MLSDYIPEVRAQAQLREQCSGADLDGFSNWLAARHYAFSTVRSYLFAVGELAVWTEANSQSRLEALDRTSLMDYRAYLSRRYRGKRGHESGNLLCGARSYLRFLRPAGDEPLGPALDPLEAGFHSWLREHRGVAQRTLDGYARIVRRLLSAIGNRPRRYTAAQLRAFVLAQAAGHSSSMADTVVTSVRLFVRFLIIRQECPEQLQHAIPRVARWSKATLPRYIAPDDVERIIAACDPSTALGARDRAVLLLLARLGLRAGDVAGLRLTDIDWTNARLQVSGKTRRPTWLPLPQDAGDAILHYLNNSRPRVEGDSVFLISRAPYTPILTRQISSTAERAIRRSGVKTPSLGAHMLRHSAATAWLRQGLTLQAVGTLLRHANPDTTAIYAKVDRGLLRRIAQPWPQEDSRC